MFDTGSTQMIHQLDDQQQRSFSDIVENMKDSELEETAREAGVQVEPGSDWRDYEKALRGVEMKDLDYAVHKGTGYYLNDLAKD
jgi:hypothetical protein